MNTEATKRIVIGEGERAGIPISAPITKSPVSLSGVRWRMKEDGASFYLEAVDQSGQWREVPFYDETR